uniref:Uncharacterized protein n=1 Tax=Picea glauca TaxID=3330 RepID=A0A101M4M8_PICGL|nr:hypothetical protein ABT39_MTgene739 [Picea glauca]
MTVYLVDLHVDLDLAGVARTWRTSLVICWERGGPFPLVQPRLHYFRGASIIKKQAIHPFPCLTCWAHSITYGGLVSSSGGNLETESLAYVGSMNGCDGRFS